MPYTATYCILLQNYAHTTVHDAWHTGCIAKAENPLATELHLAEKPILSYFEDKPWYLILFGAYF